MMDKNYASTEWIWQLALEAFGPEIDFLNLKMYHLPPLYDQMKMPIERRPEYSYITITAEKWYDLINHEYTKIGYSKEANIMIWGPTVSA